MIRLLVCTLLFSSSSFGCSCLNVGPACRYFWKVPEAVFVGKAVSVSSFWPSLLAMFTKDNFPRRVVTFDVSESFKSSLGKRVKVRTGMGGGDCGYFFEEGAEYVVWAYKNDLGELETGICTRTQPLQHAKADLEFLRSLPTLTDKAWVFGDAKELTYDPAFRPKTELSLSAHRYPPEEEYRAVRPLSGFTVSATDANGKRFQSTIDAAGNFRIDPLPPGSYRVELDLPKGSLLAPRGWGVNLPAKQCEEIHFRTAIDGQIRGAVKDAEGKPIDYLYIQLLDVDHPDSPARRFDVFINKDQSYAFEGVPPGNYLVGVNTSGGYSEYETVYYPGVTDRAKARVIHLRPAEHRAKLNLVVKRKPPRLEER